MKRSYKNTIACFFVLTVLGSCVSSKKKTKFVVDNYCNKHYSELLTYWGLPDIVVKLNPSFYEPYQAYEFIYNVKNNKYKSKQKIVSEEEIAAFTKNLESLSQQGAKTWNEHPEDRKGSGAQGFLILQNGKVKGYIPHALL